MNFDYHSLVEDTQLSDDPYFVCSIGELRQQGKLTSLESTLTELCRYGYNDNVEPHFWEVMGTIETLRDSQETNLDTWLGALSENRARFDYLARTETSLQDMSKALWRTSETGKPGVMVHWDILSKINSWGIGITND